MSDLSSIEKLKLEKMFEMEGGYVLDFTDRTFQEFIIENTNIDISDQEFLDGTSPRIYPWNQSKIENRKSSSPRIYPWGQSKI